MQKITKIMVAVLMVAALLLTTTGCQSGGAGNDTSYTMWLYSGADSMYYSDYADNPVVQYTLSKTWGSQDKAINIEFWIPASGTQIDNYNTMIGSGDYPDILDGSISESPKTMYEQGIILDLTEYIDLYMPNYKALLERNPGIKSNITFNVDGQDRILAISCIYEDYPYNFQGTMYRRDWIVKYGTNPETGAAFTGGYSDPSDPDSWTDDVVFPSGGIDPVYISDWEWMFEIFDRAIAAEGIADGYCTSIYYPGFTWNGGLVSCFGGGTAMWSADPETDECRFGGDSSHFRAYLQCLNTWYSNGWLDKAFSERTADIFYDIDSTTVRQGKVGLWVGQASQLGGRMDLNDGGATEGIYVASCQLPINDIYGTDADKFVEPDCVFGTSRQGTIYYLTSNMANKDIEAICSYFDYFYSEEGSALRTLGLNAEQAAELGSGQYESWGMNDGAYTIGENGRFVRDSVIVNDSGTLKDAVNAIKLPGLTLVSSVDEGYAESYEHSLQLWNTYPNTSFFQGTSVTSNMSIEDQNTHTAIQAKVLEFMSINAVDFIKGKTDPYSDVDWDYWCTMLGKYNYQKMNEIFQGYLDLFDFA